jgi:hypothetical protein
MLIQKMNRYNPYAALYLVKLLRKSNIATQPQGFQLLKLYIVELLRKSNMATQLQGFQLLNQGLCKGLVKK